MRQKIQKPESEEYNQYFAPYIEAIPDDQFVLTLLQTKLEETLQFICQIPADQLAKPHKTDEWSIKEVMVHLIDVERIFTYRALRQARNDLTPLVSFDQNQLVANSNANDRDIEALLAEFRAVRASTLTLFNSLDQDALTRKGESSMSVRAIAYFLAGHELHHFNSLQENYGEWIPKD